MKGRIGALIYAVVGLAMNPSWARDFDVYGSMGSQGARDECPAGQYFVGITGTTGAWIDELAVVCAVLQADGTFSPGATLSARGGTGGTFNHARCGGNDKAISEITIRRTPDYQIASVSFVCMSIKTGAKTPYKLFQGTRNTSGNAPTHACQSGELATGLTIRYGQYVNGLGLICGTVGPRAASCQPGMVWRESFEGDSACVTVAERYRLADGTCRAGYVWRDTFPGDNVCVTPRERDTAKASAAAQKTAENQMACQSYADRSLQQIAEADRLGCDFARAGDTWKSDRQYHVDNCLSHGTGAASIAEVNLVTRDSLLQSCRDKTATAAGGGKTATAIAGTDVYPDNTGASEKLCTMNVGDTGRFVETKPGEPNWVSLTAISGECAGKAGWVWNGGSLSLQ